MYQGGGFRLPSLAFGWGLVVLHFLRIERCCRIDDVKLDAELGKVLSVHLTFAPNCTLNCIPNFFF